MNTIYDGYMAELLRIMAGHNLLAQATTDLLSVKLRLNKELSDALFRHKRELDLAAGLPVEPIAWEASAVLKAVVDFNG